MNAQHVPAKRIREFLHGELPKNERDLVGLHLSYCLSCQTNKDEILLDEANVELCGMTSRSLKEATAHIDAVILVEFWKGRITDTHQLEEISEHCLICETCRHKRYEIWLHDRRDVEMRRYVATMLGMFAAIAALTRRHNRKVLPAIAVIVLGCSALPFLMSGEGFWQNVLSVTFVSDTIPPVDVINLPRVPTILNSPTDVVYKTRDIHTRKALVAGKGSATKTPLYISLSRTAAGKRSDNLWKELAQVQRINLGHPVNSDLYRGEDREDSQKQQLLPVVISRTESTGIHIQLPEESRQGKYLISLLEPEEIDTKLADDETVTADGKELAVSLDLTKVLPGEYFLLIERESEGSDEKEFLGFFPVFLIAPAAN